MYNINCLFLVQMVRFLKIPKELINRNSAVKFTKACTEKLLLKRRKSTNGVNQNAKFSKPNWDEEDM